MRPSSPSSADAEASAGLPASPEATTADVLSLFLRLLPAQFFIQLREKQQLRRQNNRIYTDAVVIWLMVAQRLMANGTLETAVMDLARGLPMEFWPRPCKRLQVGSQGTKTNLSGNTASYNQARQGLPLAIVEQSTDQAFRQLIEQVGRPGMRTERNAFFVDGSSMRMPHNEALSAQYPPGSNQHGQSHWPLLRIVVAHDLYSGLAMRPEWGALNGEHAVSEQGLLEQAIDRLPSGCIVLGDANFGVFSTAYAGTQRGHPVVLRLTLARARHLAGGELREEMDLRLQWQPSRDDRRNHPELPADASLTGRLIVRRVQPDNGAAPFLLALFTTLLEDEPGSIIELYGYRWNVETDLRSLKDTLQLDQLSSTTPEMVGKEIDVALLAYNLVRAVTCLAAQKAGLKPRQFSFTRVRNVINAFAPLIAAAGDAEQAQQLFDRMMYYVNQARLPQRKKKRPSYPRAVWPKPYKYPKRKQ
jgi:putative transposase